MASRHQIAWRKRLLRVPDREFLEDLAGVTNRPWTWSRKELENWCLLNWTDYVKDEILELLVRNT